MSGRTWVRADDHLGHRNILTFTDSDGNLIRGSKFKTIEEHDQYLIKVHNELVDPQDRVYFLGDVAINRKFLWMLDQFKGRKVLVKGNHDIFNLKDYLPYFDDIRSCVVQLDTNKNKVILTHIPIHPESLGRFGVNIHGHLHSNRVCLDDNKKKIDERYKCVSLEHTEYKPIEVYQALKL